MIQLPYIPSTDCIFHKINDAMSVCSLYLYMPCFRQKSKVIKCHQCISIECRFPLRLAVTNRLWSCTDTTDVQFSALLQCNENWTSSLKPQPTVIQLPRPPAPRSASAHPISARAAPFPLRSALTCTGSD